MQITESGDLVIGEIDESGERIVILQFIDESGDLVFPKLADIKRSESGSGLDALFGLLGKKVSDSGSCILENSYVHIIEMLRESSDSGSGVEASILTVLLQKDEYGSGVESLFARALLGKEYPTGALDMFKSLLAAIVTGETGEGVESSLQAFYQKVTDSGVGADASNLVSLIGRPMELRTYLKEYSDLRVYTEKYSDLRIYTSEVEE